MNEPTRKPMTHGWIVFWTVTITLGGFVLAYALIGLYIAMKYDS